MGASIKDVAKLAGVSSSTVSRILSNKLNVKDDTRDRVMQAVNQLNYKPSMAAKSLRNGESKLLGLIIPNIERPFYPKVIKNIEQLANEKGYSIILCDASESTKKEREFLEVLNGLYVDGIIFLPTTEETEHIRDFVGKLPIIIINRNFNLGLTCVLGDDYSGGYEIGKYLISQGHRRLSCVIDNRRRNYNIERYDGFCRALRENDIDISEDNVIRNAASTQDIYERMKTLLQRKERPTAVFAFDDTLAYGVYQAAQELGISIPEELSVVGYDNLSYDEFMFPPLASYEHPFREINETVLNLLLDEIREKSGPKGMICKLTGKLVPRKSVAQPKNKGKK